MSKTLRPSAGYIGRGVTDQSALEYMLYHQNSLAQVRPGSLRRSRSQIFGASTRLSGCFQKWTSERRRWYQPLATMPCRAGGRPVR